MNQFKLNNAYSSLKTSYILLNKELSTMEEKKEHLNQRVKELESTISSISQRTITKEEMKEMINEGLTPIINILIGKETINAETQTDKDIVTIEQNKLH
jgi:ornithine carbamoyltransferase